MGFLIFILFAALIGGGAFAYTQKDQILAWILEESGANSRMSKIDKRMDNIEKMEARFTQESRRRLKSIDEAWQKRVNDLEKLMDYNYQARDYIEKVPLVQSSKDPEMVDKLPKLQADHWNRNAQVFSRYLANKHFQKIYARQPRKGLFYGAYITDQIREDSYYEITLFDHDPNHALYRLIDDPAKLKDALDYSGEYIVSGCNVNGPPGEIKDATILEYTYGILQKQENNWKITKKAELRYLFDVPDWNLFGIIEKTTDAIRKKSKNQLSKSELTAIVKDELTSLNQKLQEKGDKSLATVEGMKTHTALAVTASKDFLLNHIQTEIVKSQNDLRDQIEELQTALAGMKSYTEKLQSKGNDSQKEVIQKIEKLSQEMATKVKDLDKKLKSLSDMQRRAAQSQVRQNPATRNPAK